jgi:adenylate cyclase
LPQEYQLNNGTVCLIARDIPVNSSYSLRINFSAESQYRPYVSYGDIISGNFDHSLVKNKVVLVGMTATGEPDTWAIPTLASKVPGVYIHAAAMDTILTERYLIDLGTTTTLMIMLLMVVITGFALPWCGTRHWTDIAKGAGIIVGLFVAYLLVGFFAFERGYILDILYPLLLLPIVYVGSIIFVVIIEQSDKRFVKELFGRYISPPIAKELVSRADSGKLDLTGEEREVTVLFADIRNFTQISEQLTPEATVAMLNKYLAVVIDTVVANGGVINKFAGDSIMAVWNAPQPQSGHAEMAVKAGWEAQRKVTVLQQSESQIPPVQFGIGVNTGKALAGSVGSVGRAEYTVIGDSVNIASRICSSTPGGEVWISADTYNQTKDYLDVEELEPRTFKGKSMPIIVYRIIAWHPIFTPNDVNPDSKK